MILGGIGENFTITVVNLIRTLGLLGVFLGVIIESVIIPIPSPLIMMGAGFILLSPDLGLTDALIQLFLIALVGAFASTLGAYIAYGIGYYGGRPAVKKYKWIFGVSLDEFDIMQAKFDARPGAIPGIIFALRAIPIVPLSVMSLIFGILRIKVQKFTLWTFLGALPRCFSLAALGWLVGRTYAGLAEAIDFFETITLVIIVVIVVAYIVYKKKLSDRLLHKIEETV